MRVLIKGRMSILIPMSHHSITAEYKVYISKLITKGMCLLLLMNFLIEEIIESEVLFFVVKLMSFLTFN